MTIANDIHTSIPALLRAALFILIAITAACGKQVDDAAELRQIGQWQNPIVPQRADPWIYRAESGDYYFTATVPEFNRIELRRAANLQGLKDAEPRVIWRKHWRGPMGANIWVPELHRIDGTWYIYFSAGEAENPWQIQLYVLSNTSADPLEGQWQEEGRIQTANDAFAVDPTTFVHSGQRYLIWTQLTPQGDHALHISAMATPTELVGPQVIMAEPQYQWEREAFATLFGASVLMKNGRVHVTYSAGGADHRSAIGMLWASDDSDLLDPASWHKSPEPVLATSARLGRFGPGSSSFTIAEDGKTDVFVYHSRSYPGLRGDIFTDPNRAIHARILGWSNGWPDFYPERLD